MRAGRRGVPGVVWDGLAELDVLMGSGRCEFCWDLCQGMVPGPGGCAGAGGGPVVEAVDGELGGGGEDGRVGALGVDVAGCGGVDDGGVEETLYVWDGL